MRLLIALLMFLAGCKDTYIAGANDNKLARALLEEVRNDLKSRNHAEIGKMVTGFGLSGRIIEIYYHPNLSTESVEIVTRSFVSSIDALKIDRQRAVLRRGKSD
jgi:hypothetical protein